MKPPLRTFLLLLFVVGECFTRTHAQSPPAQEYILQQIFNLGKKEAYEAVFSPDSRFIATLSGTHKLQVWDSQNGKLLKTLPTGKHQAVALRYHPKDPLLVTGGRDHTIHVWDVNRTTPLAVLRGHIGSVNTLSFDAQGKTLVSGGDDGAILVWDFSNLVLERTLQKAHQGAIYSVDFHPTQPLVASGGKDEKIRLWNLESSAMLVELQEHAGAITAVVFDPIGNFLASGATDQGIKLWDWEERMVVGDFFGHENAVTSLSFHPNGVWLASGGADASLRLWNIQTGEERAALKPVRGAVASVHFSYNGEHIVAAEGNNAQAWQWEDSPFLTTFAGHEDAITSLDFTKNGKYLLSAGLDQTINIWNIAREEWVLGYPTEGHEIEELRLSPNSRQFATAEVGSQIGLWETQTGARLGVLEQHRGKVNSIDYHPTDPMLLSGGDDGQWMLWNLEQNLALETNQAHSDAVTVVRFSPQGDRFATGSADESIQIWGYPDGQLLATLEGHQGTINDVAFSPTAPLLASASADNTIKLWARISPGQWNLQHDLQGHQFAVSGLAFSQDGQVLISASQDATVRLWEVAQGRFIRILSGEHRPISAFSFQPEAELIALGMEREVVLLKYSFQMNPRAANFRRAALPTSENLPESDLLAEEPALEEVPPQETAKAIVELDFYQVEEEGVLMEIRENLQRALNALLLKGEVCQNFDELEARALEVLRVAPQDLAAYHALLKVAIARQDINWVFMLTKIGGRATFMPTRYTYAQPLDVQNDFQAWRTRVFDQSFLRQGDSIFLSLQDCQGERASVEIREALLSLDIPNEFLKKVVSIPHFIDLQDFQGLPLQEFQYRLLGQIQEKSDSTEPHPNQRLPLRADFQSPMIPTGQLFVNLEQTQLWGNPQHLLFEVRRGGAPWQSYFTASDRKKRLTLPLGDYYLKLGNSIRRAFVLTSKEMVTLEGTDLH